MCLCLWGSSRRSKGAGSCVSSGDPCSQSVTAPSTTKSRCTSVAFSGLLSFVSSTKYTNSRTALDSGAFGLPIDAAKAKALAGRKEKVDVVHLATARYLELFASKEGDREAYASTTSPPATPVQQPAGSALDPLSNMQHESPSYSDGRRLADVHDALNQSSSFRCEYVPSRLSNTRMTPSPSHSLRQLAALQGPLPQGQQAAQDRTSRRATRNAELLLGTEHSAGSSQANSPRTSQAGCAAPAKPSVPARLGQTGRSRSDRIYSGGAQQHFQFSHSNLGRSHTTLAAIAPGLAAAAAAATEAATSACSSMTSRIDSTVAGRCTPPASSCSTANGAFSGDAFSHQQQQQHAGLAGPASGSGTPGRQPAGAGRASAAGAAFSLAPAGEAVVAGDIMLSAMPLSRIARAAMPLLAAGVSVARMGGIYYSKDDIHVTGLPYDCLSTGRTSVPRRNSSSMGLMSHASGAGTQPLGVGRAPPHRQLSVLASVQQQGGDGTGAGQPVDQQQQGGEEDEGPAAACLAASSASVRACSASCSGTPVGPRSPPMAPGRSYSGRVGGGAAGAADPTSITTGGGEDVPALRRCATTVGESTAAAAVAAGQRAAAVPQQALGGHHHACASGSGCASWLHARHSNPSRIPAPSAVAAGRSSSGAGLPSAMLPSSRSQQQLTLAQHGNSSTLGLGAPSSPCVAVGPAQPHSSSGGGAARPLGDSLALASPGGGGDGSLSSALALLKEACLSHQLNPELRSQRLSMDLRTSAAGGMPYGYGNGVYASAISGQLLGVVGDGGTWQGSGAAGAGSQRSARLLGAAGYSSGLAGGGGGLGLGLPGLLAGQHGAETVALGERLGVIVGSVAEEGEDDYELSGALAAVGLQAPAVRGPVPSCSGSLAAPCAPSAAAVAATGGAAEQQQQPQQPPHPTYDEFLDDGHLHATSDEDNDEEVVYKYEGFSILGRESSYTAPPRLMQSARTSGFA